MVISYVLLIQTDKLQLFLLFNNGVWAIATCIPIKQRCSTTFTRTSFNRVLDPSLHIDDGSTARILLIVRRLLENFVFDAVLVTTLDSVAVFVFTLLHICSIFLKLIEIILRSLLASVTRFLGRECGGICLHLTLVGSLPPASGLSKCQVLHGSIGSPVMLNGTRPQVT